MAAFDVDRALRWAHRAPSRTLARRPDADLPFASERDLAGRPLLLDTCVYIDQMQGRAPALVERLVDTRSTNHSTVAIQELMHAVGALRPDDRRTAAAVSIIRDQIRAMPEHRVFVPDAEVLGRGALLAGLLCRLQGYSDDARLKALHDAVLFLQARKLGCAALTANIGDFDALLQLVPTGHVLFYRRDAGGPKA